jgi:hypothetical protein
MFLSMYQQRLVLSWLIGIDSYRHVTFLFIYVPGPYVRSSINGAYMCIRVLHMASCSQMHLHGLPMVSRLRGWHSLGKMVVGPSCCRRECNSWMWSEQDRFGLISPNGRNDIQLSFCRFYIYKYCSFAAVRLKFHKICIGSYEGTVSTLWMPILRTFLWQIRRSPYVFVCESSM